MNLTGVSGATLVFTASFTDPNSFNGIGWSYAGVNYRFAPYYEWGSWRLSTYDGPNALSYFDYGLHEYVFVATVDSVSLYVDGSLRDSISQQNNFGQCANKFRIMAYGNDSDGIWGTYPGTFHNAYAYTKALTAAEIAANYAIDRIRFGLT